MKKIKRLAQIIWFAIGYFILILLISISNIFDRKKL